MFKLKWDKRSNCVILTNSLPDEQSLNSPRPVFFEELDLLGFDEYWDYPKSVDPLLWAIGRRYYHKGEKVAHVPGGNMYDKPAVEITEEGKNRRIRPINMDLFIKRNREALFTLENEAMDFIEHSYKKNKDSNCFAVSFSGGKDSQVILDLVSRVLPPDEYIVSFTDTNMEIPFTYKAVKNTKKIYQNLYPNLKFYTARYNKDSCEMWNKFGPPSRLIRWCCSVYKTAPFARLMRKLHNANGPPKILVFEGVRADESAQRSRYQRNAEQVKHVNITNSRPILHWNTTEVFLYLFYRNIKLNEGYRYGMRRIGCSVCPFATKWSEYIISTLFPDLTKEYIEILKDYAQSMGVNSKKKVKKYIKEGKWKTRAGGLGVDTKGTRIDIMKQNRGLNAILYNPKTDWLTWIKTLGDVVYQQDGKKVNGELRINGNNFPFKLNKKNEIVTVFIENVLDKPILMSRIKNTLYKATYCINCGACQVECPTGALQTIPCVKVNKEQCIHCHNCLTFTKRGCLMAKSAVNKIRSSKMGRRSGVDRYSTFGMRGKWVDSYLGLMEEWWASERMTLGVKQVPAFTHWLIDAGMVDSNKKATEFSNKAKNIYYKNPLLFWELIWINLAKNSQVVNWYTDTVRWSVDYSKEELIHLMMDDFPTLSEGTIYNAITALINTFDTTPLGDKIRLGILEKKGRAIKNIKKIGPESKIHPMAVAYSLYNHSEIKNRKYFTISELYEESCKSGPYNLFGISRSTLEKTLRWLQENEKIITVELKADLENISLRDDMEPTQVVDRIVKNL
ncbi:MAG: DUF4007 family protein [Kosmotogaceae bacterium]